MQNDVKSSDLECIESVNNTTIRSAAVETVQTRCGNEAPTTASSTQNDLSTTCVIKSQSTTGNDRLLEEGTSRLTERTFPKQADDLTNIVETSITTKHGTSCGAEATTNPPIQVTFNMEETNIRKLSSDNEERMELPHPKQDSTSTKCTDSNILERMEPGVDTRIVHQNDDAPSGQVHSEKEEATQSIVAAAHPMYISNASSTPPGVPSSSNDCIPEQTRQSSVSISPNQQQLDQRTTSDRSQQSPLSQSPPEQRGVEIKAELDVESSYRTNTAPVSVVSTTGTVAEVVEVLPTNVQTNVQTTNLVADTTSAVTAIPRKPNEVIESPKSMDDDLTLARQPLTDLYGSFVCHTSDTCLKDARDRLKKALNQTWMLRKAFTDRVYSKYRVCLRPAPEPEQVIANVLADPIGSDERLRNEIALIREEKEIEKKETVQLNLEMAASKEKKAELVNVDNAEQLMYFTAGLNLVILPEEQLSLDEACRYPDRGPINPTTGQRAKGISQAAAIAGEVVLERARKSANMMAERTQRHPFLSAVSNISKSVGDNSCPPVHFKLFSATEQTASIAPLYPVAKLVAERQTPSNSVPVLVRKPESRLSATDLKRRKGDFSKLNRTRHPAHFFSLNNLISMNPTCDELRSSNMKPGAATAWLIANSSFYNSTINTNSESLGGKRKRPFDTSNLSASAEENELQLPSLPNRIERSLYNRHLPVFEMEDIVTDDVRNSVHEVLGDFSESTLAAPKGIRSITKIGLLRKRKSIYEQCTNSIVTVAQLGSKRPQQSKEDTRSRLTLSVLCAVGLVKSQKAVNDIKISAAIPSPSVHMETFQSSRMAESRSVLVSSKKTVFGTMKNENQEKGNSAEAEALLIKSEEQKTEENPERISIPIPLESIRGGGQVSKDEENEFDHGISKKRIPNGASLTNDSAIFIPPDATNQTEQPRKRQRASSSPSERPANTPSIQHSSHVPLVPHIVASPGVVSTNAASTSPFPPQQPAFDQFYASTFPFSAASLHHHVASAYMLHNQAAGDLAQNFLATQAALIAQQSFERQSTSGQSIALNNVENFASQLSNGNHLVSNVPFPVKMEQGPPHVSNALQTDASSEYSRPLLTESVNKVLKADVHEPSIVNTDANVSTEQVSPACEKPAEEVSPIGDTYSTLPGSVTKDNDSKSKQDDDKLNFQAPPIPDSLDHRFAHLIQSGKFHEVTGALSDSIQLKTALEYLLEVGSAVPIPKSFVLSPLKEQLNTAFFRQTEVPQIPRDVVIAVVMTWLWSKHECTFQSAFSVNGRIDVDSDCKHLVQLVVAATVRVLSLEISESLKKGIGAFAEAAIARKMSLVHKIPPESVKLVSSKRVELCTASVVSATLNDELYLDSAMDFWLPNLHSATDLLDEARLLAFRFKARERTLLANFLSRRSMIDETLSDAFVGSVVRAGEAYGHDQLFEEVQNEKVAVSSMLPYDIFTEESGLWEDPARPLAGFASGLTGDELFRRAHARATIQMSLQKLQERNNIRGGMNSSGPYFEDDTSNFVVPSSAEALVVERSQSGAPSPRPTLKRKVSAVLDTNCPSGTGSAPAYSATVYDPKHLSMPIEWDSRSVAHSPYGIHSFAAKRQSMLASSRTVEPRKVKREPIGSAPILGSTRKVDYSGSLSRSTHEVNWADVASVFHLVKLPRKSSSRIMSSSNSNSSDNKIYAPFFHPVGTDGVIKDNEDEHSGSESDEDISDEAVLRRHQVILDDMRESLNKVNEARRRLQDNRKNRQK